MEELAAFVKGLDQDRLMDLGGPDDFGPKTIAEIYEQGHYQSMIEAVRRNGFLLEPYYKGRAVESYDIPRIINKFDLKYAHGVEGVGYGFMAPVDGDVTGIIRVYYLNEADEKDAKNNPYRYKYGKNTGMTLNQAKKAGWIKRDLMIGEKEVVAYWRPFIEDNDVDWLTFVYEEKFLILMYFYGNEDGFGCLDFVKDLTFELIPLRGE